MLPLANIGMPMLLFAGPVFVLGFIPIVLIESWVIARSLRLRFRSALWSVTNSNLASTLAGIPAMWMLIVILSEIAAVLTLKIHAPYWVWILLSPGWQPPDPKEPFWVVPVCNLVLLVPFYFGSVFVEARVNRQILGQSADVTKATARANLASYALLAVFWLVALKLHPGTWMYRT